MTNQHTTGPWAAATETVWRHHRDGSYLIAEGCTAANAALIAQAPDLLAIAEAVANGDTGQAWQLRARMVIARALRSADDNTMSLC